MFRVIETYSGTREVDVDALTEEEAISVVRTGGGKEVHRYEEPTAPYEARELD